MGPQNSTYLSTPESLKTVSFSPFQSKVDIQKYKQ